MVEEYLHRGIEKSSRPSHLRVPPTLDTFEKFISRDKTVGAHGQVREMSFPATPPPDHLPKSSPGSPHSPPASPLPQDSETVNLVDSSDSDDEAQQKAKRLKRSQRAPNYLTFTFPVDISSILQ